MCKFGGKRAKELDLIFAHIAPLFIKKRSMKNLTIIFYTLAALAGSISAQSTNQSMLEKEIPNVAFCEMVKNPESYFDKPIKISATYWRATEGTYLGDVACPPGQDEQIGAVLKFADEEHLKIEREKLNRIGAPEYGGKARVVAVGILRNESRRAFTRYKYRFDIIRIEKISPVVVPYAGLLEGGTTYRAPIRFDKNFGIAPVEPVQTPRHYAVRLEWTNLADFPALEKLRRRSAEKQIVFSVLSVERKQVTANRWNMTIRCKIIGVE